MEIATDLMASLRERLGTGVSNADYTALDWQGLHARLTAAHAARCAMALASDPLVFGGFSNWQVDRGLSEGNSSRAVNPTDSTKRKTPAGMKGAVATEPFACGRG